MNESPELKSAADRFFKESFSHSNVWGHPPPNPIQELEAGLQSGLLTVARGLSHWENRDKQGIHVLDVGSSWGPLVFGAAGMTAVASATGIDIEETALALANCVKGSALLAPEVAAKTSFVEARCEALPFPSSTFDFITCHTVIEHVDDVEQSIREMLRVLKPGGMIHLEAPNYLWPYEPHLGIWMPPLAPKVIARAIARIAGRSPDFLEHLKFVSPFSIEAILRKHGASFENLYLKKLRSILVEGNTESVVGMKRLAEVAKTMQKIGAGKALMGLFKASKVYPSIEYKISRKPSS